MKRNEDSPTIDVRHRCRPHMYVIRVKIEKYAVKLRGKALNNFSDSVNTLKKRKTHYFLIFLGERKFLEIIL
jgi:hypothetical protein